jgi:acetyl esterase/lipase
MRTFLLSKLNSVYLALFAALLAPAVASASPQVLELWPEGVPDLKTNGGEERLVDGRIVNVQHPTLTVYAPANAGTNGTAVILCPGGGYVRLSVGANGGPDTQFLNACGATVFILKYRLAEYGHPAPLRDVLRAVRLVRSRAAEFGIRPDRIGVWGASAGGHLAACAATLFDSPEGKTGAAMDSVSARPDFVTLVYPVITMEDPYVHKSSRTALLGSKPAPELIQGLSLEKQVRPDMPPVFIVATMADKTVPVQNSLLFYQALCKAGVPAEMHVYAQGNHGNSHDPQYGPTAEWPKRLQEWLHFNQWIP